MIRLWVFHRFPEGVMVNWCVCCTTMDSAPHHSIELTLWKPCCQSCQATMGSTHSTSTVCWTVVLSDSEAVTPNQWVGFWAVPARVCHWFKLESTEMVTYPVESGEDSNGHFQGLLCRHSFPGWASGFLYLWRTAMILESKHTTITACVIGIPQALTLSHLAEEKAEGQRG